MFHLHLSKKKQRTGFDKVVAVAAFAYPLSGLPQAILVFQGSTDGVSLTSWVSFSLFSLLFLIWGIMHKIKPIIVTNLLWLLVDIFIVVGTITHRMIY